MGVRIGLIGAGGTGRAHLDALSAMKNVEITAVCDTDRSRARQAALAHAATPYINFRTMLEREELDALYICLPPYAHSDAEILAAAKGIHLFIEPPVALTAERATQIAAAIDKAAIITSVGTAWRYLSAVEEARAFIEQRPVGMIVGQWLDTMPATSWWHHREKSGGQLVEELLHLIDLARHLNGEVEAVFAAAHHGIMARRVEGHTVNDADVLCARFRNGVPACFFSTNLLPATDDISLRLFADGAIVKITRKDVELREEGRRTVIAHQGSHWAAESEAFIAAVQAGSAQAGGVRSTYGDAAASLQVALAGLHSMETRKAVVL